MQLLDGTACRTTSGHNDGARDEEGNSPSLWGRILGMINRDLDVRRARRLFVEVRSRSGSCRKEIGDLSVEDRRSLHPALGEYVAERLLDRYLAEQGSIDLADKRRAYTKKVGDLTPEDLPALVEADRQRVEEERERERERTQFIQEARTDLERLPVIGPAGMVEAGRGGDKVSGCESYTGGLEKQRDTRRVR